MSGRAPRWWRNCAAWFRRSMNPRSPASVWRLKNRSARSRPVRPVARSRTPGERVSLSDEALKGFRDGLEKPAPPESAAPAPSAPPRSSRSAYVPPVAHEFDRLETRDASQIDPEALEALTRA